jgi:glutaredoxin-related protein
VSSLAHTLSLLPPDLHREVQAAHVVLFVSPLTDARPVTGWLERHGVEFQRVELGMASALSRDEFRRLQAATGWRSLPQIFIEGRFVGGIEEFFDHPEVVGARGAAAAAPVARWLGYLGALPFVAGALGLLTAGAGSRALALQALIGYGAVILSFVGALHWTRGLEAGAAPEGARLLMLSVLPALLAWVAVLLPASEGLLMLAAGFALLYLFDRRAWRHKPWFLRLRLHLSAVAVLCLTTGAVVAAPPA